MQQLSPGLACMNDLLPLFPQWPTNAVSGLLRREASNSKRTTCKPLGSWTVAVPRCLVPQQCLRILENKLHRWSNGIMGQASSPEDEMGAQGPRKAYSAAPEARQVSGVLQAAVWSLAKEMPMRVGLMKSRRIAHRDVSNNIRKGPCLLT